MKYSKPSEMAEKWGFSPELVRCYCINGRVDGAICENGSWLIPSDADKPERKKREQKPRAEPPKPYLVKKLCREKTKKVYHGLYDYIQINFAYSNGRLATNRLMRVQVEELFQTDKVKTGFETMKVDDLIECTNHFICVDHILETATQPLTQSYIKRLHQCLLYGTFAERKNQCRIGEYRTDLCTIGKTKMTAPKNINSQMSELLGWYERLSSVEFNQIVEFHVRFERIHPFDDGNGRIGRLLMFKECLRWGVSPFILDDKRRSRYLSGLRSWDYDHADLLSICYEAQQRFARQITAQKAGEEHHKQLVRMGFYKRKHCLEDTLD